MTGETNVNDISKKVENTFKSQVEMKTKFFKIFLFRKKNFFWRLLR